MGSLLGSASQQHCLHVPLFRAVRDDAIEAIITAAVIEGTGRWRSKHHDDVRWIQPEPVQSVR